MSLIQDEFTKAIPTVLLGAIVPPIVGYFCELRERRHADELRSIDICSRKVSFISEWLNAQSLCDPENIGIIKAQVADELYSLKDDLAKQLLEAKELRKEKELDREKPNIWKGPLLAYRPLGSLAWTLHLFYWYALAISCFFALAVFTSSLKESSLLDAIGSVLVVFFVASVALIPLGLLASWSQRRSSKRKKQANMKSLEIINSSGHIGIS